MSFCDLLFTKYRHVMYICIYHIVYLILSELFYGNIRKITVLKNKNKSATYLRKLQISCSLLIKIIKCVTFNSLKRNTHFQTHLHSIKYLYCYKHIFILLADIMDHKEVIQYRKHVDLSTMK